MYVCLCLRYRRRNWPSVYDLWAPFSHGAFVVQKLSLCLRLFSRDRRSPARSRDRLIGFAGWRRWFAATIRGPYSPVCAASRRKLAAGGELVFLPFEAHYNLSGCKFKQILFNASWRSGAQALSIPTEFASKKSNVLQR